ncbi:MAG: response regulator [Burkholderiales bacterium]|nr:response regulator [Burkholderiales bacterium]
MAGVHAFERLLAELSASFINLPPAEVDVAITRALGQIVGLFGADRGLLIRFATESEEATITHGWVEATWPETAPKVVSRLYPWVVQRLRTGAPVVIPRIEDMPLDASTDRDSFRRVRVKSMLSVPMAVGGRLEGAIAFTCVQHARDWPEELVDRTRILADVFGNALAHKRAREALDAAMRFERLLSGILAALLSAGRADRDRIIDSSLRDVAQALGAERATLWQRVGEQTQFVDTNRWVAEGVPAPPERMVTQGTQWISTQLLAGRIVSFSRHADLPPQAAPDLPVLRALGIRAGVMVPIAVSGAVVGAVSLATVSEDRDWPVALMPRVKLLGDVFANLLARMEAERREQEAQALAAHAERVGTMGVIAASLVHELTQPLAAILSNAETAAALLAAPAIDVGELRATVEDIVADDRRAVELIQQLRRFLRRSAAERAELDLREAIDAVLRLVAGDAAAKGIEIALDCADSLPKLIGDRIQIQQVLLNLLLNAVDAVAGNATGRRRVTVLARSSSGGVSVAVSDNGCGMDDAARARIFQPFFTTKPGGMGLGLPICHTIVAAHGGTLAVDSAPGRGSTSRLELPLVPAETAHPAAREVMRTASEGTVFVIDDDPAMRRALGRQLEAAGYRVEPFASAQDYLDRAPAPAGAACIVSDVRMPGLSGLDLQASLARAARDLPMVFISGHGDVAIAAHAMKAGAVNFLAKPFSRGELLAAVTEALARSRVLVAERKERAVLQNRYDALTPREREVFGLVAAGLLNKRIADRLGAAEKTVKIHRGRVMEKMQAASVADLVRMAGRLGLRPTVAAPD